VDGEGVEDSLPAVDLAGRVGPVDPPFDGDEVEDLQRPACSFGKWLRCRAALRKRALSDSMAFVV
jgi:hypothetical protein